MLRSERCCRKHLIIGPKRTKVGDIFRHVMLLPPKSTILRCIYAVLILM